MQARYLFIPKILKHLSGVAIPDPLPFSGVEFEPRQSLKYRAVFDVESLIANATEELALGYPEAFKVFLFAVMVGLRRKQIDLLDWDSFLWNSGVVKVQATQHFDAKTDDILDAI